MEEEHDGHDSLTCPQCRAAAESCRILSGLAEGLERMIGTFERMGRETAPH